MRGKPCLPFLSLAQLRITPADAGKTCGLGVLQRAHEDHPRGCGENRSYPFDAPVLAGSPPRMRGKHRDLTEFHQRPRITPADAGKTPRRG